MAGLRVSYNKLPQLTQHLAKLGDKHLHVGVFDTDKRPGEDISNSELAIIHTYGTETLPARPFLQPAMRKHAQQYAIALQALVAKAIKEAVKTGKEPNATDIFQPLKLRVVADVKQFIRDNLVKPPDQPETIERKGSDITLIDSGRLVKSITGRVL